MRQLGFWQRTTSTTGSGESSPAFPKDLADPAAVAHWLSRTIGRAVTLRYTKNRSTMLSFREDDSVLRVRLHRMFADATRGEMLALAAYLRDGDVEAGKVLDRFIRQHKDEFREPVTVQPVGRFHHLQEMFDELNRDYFHDSCKAFITWGKAAARRRRRRSIQLGSYVSNERLIRIHPCLDQAFVPRYYVAWVIFHEMLHEVFGIEGNHGRRSLHPPEFMAIEESYPDYIECKKWEEANIHRLLRY